MALAKYKRNETIEKKDVSVDGSKLGIQLSVVMHAKEYGMVVEALAASPATFYLRLSLWETEIF